MSKNVKSIPIDGQIIVTRPDNTTDIFHPKTTTEYVVLSDSDKSSANIPENTDTVSELIGKFGKLAFKDEVNLDSIEFNNASQTEDGLMSKEDKTKLDSIPSTGFFVDSELSEDSENPVQNKVITKALKSVSIPVDEELNFTSINPVQNKVITSELNKKTTFEVGTEIPSTPNTIFIELK